MKQRDEVSEQQEPMEWTHTNVDTTMKKGNNYISE